MGETIGVTGSNPGVPVGVFEGVWVVVGSLVVVGSGFSVGGGGSVGGLVAVGGPGVGVIVGVAVNVGVVVQVFSGVGVSRGVGSSRNGCERGDSPIKLMDRITTTPKTRYTAVWKPGFRFAVFIVRHLPYLDLPWLVGDQRLLKLP